MSLHTSKNCTAEDCQRLWETVVLPNLKHQKQKMGLNDIQKLMALVKIWGDRSWDAVASGMGRGYSAFQCFSAYEYFSPGEIDTTTRDQIRHNETQLGVYKFNKVVKLGNEFLSNITKEKFANLACQVTGVLVDAPNIPLQTMAEHYNRFSNPDVQKRTFKLVEDLLLLVCMVKMRAYLIQDKSFAPLRYYLPWRFVSTWACRADIIFGRKTAVWSREEDLKLLQYAANKQKFDWKLFSLKLGPDKNRKNTRGRYVRLQERLRYESFDNIRQEYEKQDRNCAAYTSFPKYIKPLQDVLNFPQSEVPSYEQLCHSPDDTILWNYLQSFDKIIIEETLRDLKEVAVHAEQFLKLPNEKQLAYPHEKSKPIDRRKFVRGDSASTASAIHLRKVALKPKEEVENLTTFQMEVYSHFECFKAKSVKTRTERKYLPSVSELLKMAEIHSILCPPKSKVNKENPTDGVTLDDNGYPILDT
ncbi:unnamed protein product [Allacma fusca]|uniref:Myb-like domain-containing protein n=1 Tax=Allacma fusca TaxID=39272 RepID=A0A8J2NSQ6_9HEXA|nr:unnamed protein product [Allacma fusca]